MQNMASVGDRRKDATSGLPRRTSRDEGLVREVRWRLSKDRDLLNRMRQLERMERTARLWVNGEEVGEPCFPYLGDVHD
jgi:hypothetical protein